jgi:hypothetical protein
MPRYYDPVVEDVREREERIRRELKLKKNEQAQGGDYRERISGAFKSSRRQVSRQADPSASLNRIIILLFLSVLLVGYLQFGPVALYGLLLFVPFYLYLKFRRS